MKKIFAVLLVFVLIFGFVGCGSNATDEVSEIDDVSETGESVTVNESTESDESFAGKYVYLINGNTAFVLEEDGTTVSAAYGNGEWSVREDTITIAYLGGSVIRNYLIYGSYFVQTDITLFGPEIPSEGAFDGEIFTPTIRYEFFSDGSMTMTQLSDHAVAELTYERIGDLIKFVLDDGKENTLLIHGGGINDSVVIKGK